MAQHTNKFSFVFPGQGSQSLGMMASMADAYPVVQECFAKASDVLGFDLWQLTQQGPEEKLNQTEYTQPALLAASIAAWQVWCSESDIRPDFVAGHSLGEYSALVAAQALSFEDAIRLVSSRGRFMQQAVPEGQGAMAAILGLEKSQVESACIDAAKNEVVEPANINAPGQIVIAGDKTAVERACHLLKEMGAKRALILPVSVPSHCGLMQSAALMLEKMLDEITIELPKIPLLHNVNADLQTTPKAIKTALVSQLYKPVQWIETIENLSAKGVKTVVECGPGKVLSGLTKRIDKSLCALNLNEPKDVTSLKDSLEVTHEVYES